ncbi:hypothetical protein DNR41_27310, partial [Escherichia coli]
MPGHHGGNPAPAGGKFSPLQKLGEKKGVFVLGGKKNSLISKKKGGPPHIEGGDPGGGGGGPLGPRGGRGGESLFSLQTPPHFFGR